MTDEELDGLEQVLGPLTPENASAVAYWFAKEFAGGSVPDVDRLGDLLCPESPLKRPGYIKWVYDFIEGSGLAPKPELAKGAPDVAYVKLPHDGSEAFRVPEGVSRIVLNRAYITLVNRPSLGGWRVYDVVPEKIPPEELPRE